MSTPAETLAAFKTFWKGFKVFEKTGVATPEAYPAMRKLYVDTNGRFNDLFHFLYCLNKPYRPIGPNENKFLNLKGQNEIDEAVTALNKDGYYIFPQRLDDQALDQLMQFALETPCVLQYDNAAVQPGAVTAGGDVNPYLTLGHAVDTDVRFDPHNLVATNYTFAEKHVINNPLVQTLLCDPDIVNIAQQYFRSQAMYTTACIWWTTAFGCNSPSSALAQLYHFDMDRIKFLKYFCYLTDVGPDDGPHCFVRNSVKRKPEALRRDGRFQDSEIESQYDPKDIIEITAPRGTIIVEDTRGFHKAKMPTKGNRLVLQLELASCLFGPPYPKSTITPRTPAIQKSLQQNPQIWSNFSIEQQTAVVQPLLSR
jgi:hypothetical protein